MGFKYCPYYVGLLKAAALHGATHQAVMEFQVMVGKRISKIHTGRSIIAFYFSKNISNVTRGIQLRKTPTGYMKISSPELTALDLVRYPNGTAGSDNLATVLKDLGSSLNAQKLAELSTSFERTVTQRLGYLLDYLGYENQTALLHQEISSSQFNWVELTPLRSPYADLLIPPVDRDKKWRIIVRFHPDPDF